MAINYKERIEKAQDKIIAKRITIDKKIIWSNKATKEKWEVEILLDDIKRLEREVKEIETTIDNYKSKLAEQNKKENELEEAKELFKDFTTSLVNNWNEHDLKLRDKLKADYNKLDYKEFYQKYKMSDTRLKDKTKKQIEEDNQKSADTLIYNMITRVKEKVGKITDYSGLYIDSAIEGICINGVIVGKLGKVRIESITAGGYNIQKLHVRVLVKDI